jgi:hypothetical protein
MNTKLRFLIIILLVGTILLPASIVSAKANRIEFTGTETCDKSTTVLPRIWLAGPNLQIRGFSQTCYETESIPEMTGTTYLYDGVVVVKSDGNYMVKVKFRLETDEGGVWVGSAEKPVNATLIECVGHGEGIYKGLELHWFLEDGDIKPGYGYIIDHSD